MIAREQTALLVVVSAPSGAGKTTLCKRLLEERKASMVYSVSCTTRPPRSGEQDGFDYHFLDEAEFSRRVEAGSFIEHAHVHGYWYGTLKEDVFNVLRSGRDLLMDLDVQGARRMRAYIQTAPDDDLLRRGYVDIFIAPPSMETLERRLRERGKDHDETITRRLNVARKELALWYEYQYLIVNDRLDASYNALKSIVSAEHHRTRMGLNAFEASHSMA